MKKGKTDFGSILVLLAGLVILAHFLIPHHHHFDDLRSPHVYTTCTGDLPEHQDDNPQVHCHAFNLLVNQRVNSLVIQLLPQSDFHCYVAVQFSDGASRIRAYQKYNYPAFTILQLRQLSSAGNSLRAPPIFGAF